MHKSYGHEITTKLFFFSTHGHLTGYPMGYPIELGSGLDGYVEVHE